MLTSKDRISWCVLVCVCVGNWQGAGEALAEYFFLLSLFLSAEALGNSDEFLLRSGAWGGKALRFRTTGAVVSTVSNMFSLSGLLITVITIIYCF